MSNVTNHVRDSSWKLTWDWLFAVVEGYWNENMSEMTFHLKLCLTLYTEKEECEMSGIELGLVQSLEDQICCG